MTEHPHEICSWCWTEGQLTVLSDGTDPIAALLALEDGEVSHGICPGHKEQMRALIPGKNLLVGGAKCA